MRKRSIISLVAGALMAAVLPAAAAAQTQADVALTFSLNPTCEFGQGSSLSLPACRTHARGTIPAITFSNPQSTTGAFTGIQTLNGTYLPNLADRTFEASGTAVFAGEVEGCGVGVVYFDYRGSGTIATDGSNVFESDTYTAVPGGSLSIVGSIAQSGIDAANGDGTSTAPYSGTYACDIYGLSGSPLMRP